MDALIFVLIMLVLSAALVLGTAYMHRWLLWPLLLGFGFRLILIVMHRLGVFSPPGANADAARFTRVAQEWSFLEWGDLLVRVDATHSHFYALLGAIVHKVVGISNLVLPAFNFLFGHIVIIVGGLIVYQLFNKRAAVMAAYILALYPFAAFNSIIALREEVGIMFFMIGLLFFLRWVGGRSLLGIVPAFVFFGVAVTFHPGWIGVFVGVAFYLTFLLLRSLLAMRHKNFSRLEGAHIVLAFVFLIGAMGLVGLNGGISLGKGIEVGTEAEGSIGDTIAGRFTREPSGGSAYPSFVATGNPYAQPWLIPARIVYFHFSPFPWDIRSPHHLLGLVSSSLYFFLTWRVYRGWHEITRKDECVAALFIFGALTLIFALGVTNVGTAIRHKTKFLALFVILAAASFDRFNIRLRRA